MPNEAAFAFWKAARKSVFLGKDLLLLSFYRV